MLLPTFASTPHWLLPMDARQEAAATPDEAIEQLVLLALDGALMLGLLAFAVVFTLAVFVHSSADGDEDQRTRAKRMMRTSILGALGVALMYGAVEVASRLNAWERLV